MALFDWVAATATLATVATVPPRSGSKCRRVATVAVAAPTENEAATPEEAAELRELLAVILKNDTDADRAEALAVALADPDAALLSFRLLAEGFRTSTHAPARGADDRRRCADCANLSAREHRCLAAWRGERPGNVARTYHPVIDIPAAANATSRSRRKRINATAPSAGRI